MIASLFLALAIAGGTGTPRCLAPSGPKIVAGDLVPAVAAFAKLPPELVLGFSPQPGVTRTLAPAELLQWLSRHQATPEAAITEPVCFAWPLTQPDASAIQAAMEESLPPGANVRIVEISQFAYAPGAMSFPLTTLRQNGMANQPSVWKGYVEYLPGARQEIWAKVEVRVPSRRVLTTRGIRAGEVIDESMIRLETGDGPLLPPGLAQDPTEVVGRAARYLLPAGGTVPLGALDKLVAVKRGDPVRINVVAGAARIGMDGIALASAAEGDLVGVKVTDTGRTVRVRVASVGQTVLDVGRK